MVIQSVMYFYNILFVMRNICDNDFKKITLSSTFSQKALWLSRKNEKQKKISADTSWGMSQCSVGFFTIIKVVI